MAVVRGHGGEVESASMSFDTHDPRFNANAALSVVGDGEMDVVGRGNSRYGALRCVDGSTADAPEGTATRKRRNLF